MSSFPESSLMNTPIDIMPLKANQTITQLYEKSKRNNTQAAALRPASEVVIQYMKAGYMRVGYGTVPTQF
jgi:hypothetical protein